MKYDYFSFGVWLFFFGLQTAQLARAEGNGHWITMATVAVSAFLVTLNLRSILKNETEPESEEPNG